jgi:hypothetical protein
VLNSYRIPGKISVRVEVLNLLHDYEFKTDLFFIKSSFSFVLQGQGKALADAVRQIGVTVQAYYRWRKEYGGVS